ncbi:MAG: clostripain-related cysteine peptidase [Caldilineaceae bacterium]
MSFQRPPALPVPTSLVLASTGCNCACDNEGELSAPAAVLIFVAQRKPEPPFPPVSPPDVTQPPPTPPSTCAPGGLWTFLLYLDADYKDEGQLSRAYQNALSQLNSLNHACIQIAIQLDGPGTGDTLRLYKGPGQSLTPSDSLTAEVGMDEVQALSAFIAWGQQQLPADHYYLALANHGDGVRGTLWDHTSNPNGTAYLRVAALRTALEDEQVLPIDILHLDSCSMALLEVAYQLRNKVQYLIASQYLGWSFFAYGDYARYAGDYPEPAGLARQIVQRYGALAANHQVPTTLSVLDLRRIEPVKNGLDALAVRLKACVGNDDLSRHRHQQLESIRRQSQQFDSNVSYTNDELDAYVDLLDWLEQLRNANLNSEITAATIQLQAEFTHTDKLILENYALSNPLPKYYANGQFIDLNRANGLSIYYPLEGTRQVTSATATSNTLPYTQLFADYLDHKLFDFTRVSRWDEFLRASFGTPPTDPAQLEPPLPPPAPLTVAVVNAIYLPVVMR